jgi:type I restriction enzyme R subunit
LGQVQAHADLDPDGALRGALADGLHGEIADMRLRLRGPRKIVYTDFKDEVLGVREEQAVQVPKMTGAQYEKKVNDYLRSHLNHLVIHRLRTNQPLTELDLKGPESTLAEIGEEQGESLLSDLLARSHAPSLAHFVRTLVGLDRAAAQAAFSRFLNDRSLTAPQIRFIELVIDQLTARGVITAAALYEPPFSDLHTGGPDALFAGRENVIDGVYRTLEGLEPRVQGAAG